MNAILNPFDKPERYRAQTLVLVGMPGSGKSSIGRRLAVRMGLPFVDSDTEVEVSAGMKIPEIFKRLGESAFREGEKRVIARLLGSPPHVLATGGGTFMDEDTRHHIRAHGISLWLRAPLEVLLERTSRRTEDRPLLQQQVDAGIDPAVALRTLLELREPIYAEADITVLSEQRPVDEIANRALQALNGFLSHSSKAGI